MTISKCWNRQRIRVRALSSLSDERVHLCCAVIAMRRSSHTATLVCLRAIDGRRQTSATPPSPPALKSNPTWSPQIKVPHLIHHRRNGTIGLGIGQHVCILLKCRVVVRTRSEAHTRSPKTATIAIDEVVDHDVKGITEPECMVVVLTQTTPRKISAYLSTLKYGSKQSACSVPGHKLLKWLLKYVEHGFVSHVAVEDASQTNIGGTKVWLGLFRKFCTGQTWYEQYGFLPKDQYDRWAFQRSFDVVRRARIKDVRSFIWLIIQPFIRLKRKDTNELLNNVKFVEYSRSNKKHVKSMTRVIDALRTPVIPGRTRVPRHSHVRTRT